jgi:CAF1 family ribonuclease
MNPYAITFLRNNKMDFGTWITKGLGYSNQKGEEALRKKFLEQGPPPLSNEAHRISLTRDADIAFLSRNSEKLEAFLSNNDQKEFTFEKCNPYLRKVLHQLMEFDHPTLTVCKSADDRIQVLKLTEEEKVERLKKVAIEAKKSFETAMGFRLVFLDLVASKKPVIGHNCLFDFMFMMRWLDTPFAEGDMQTLTGFKKKFNSYFPVVFDTKYIASCEFDGIPMQDSALGELYSTTVRPATESGALKLSFANGFEGFYTGGGQFHDAGYDAYCTGAIFTQQLKTSGSMAKMTELAGNKLFMMYSMFHMDLEPGNPNGWLKITGSLVHLSNFGADTKNDAVLAIFTAAGYELNTLEVSWIDGTSLFVAVNSTESGEDILSKVVLPTDWALQTYAQFTTEAVAEVPCVEDVMISKKMKIAETA